MTITISSLPLDMTSSGMMVSDTSVETQSRNVPHAKGFQSFRSVKNVRSSEKITMVIKLMDAYIPGVTFHSHLNISSFNTAYRAEEQKVGVDFYMWYFIALSPRFKWGGVKIDESSALSSRRVDECHSSDLGLLFGSQYCSTQIKLWSKTKIQIDFQPYQNMCQWENFDIFFFSIYI